MTQKIKTTLSIFSIFVFLILFGSISIHSQQIPGEEDFQDVGAVGTTNELEKARDVLWDTILNKSDDPISNVLDDVDVPLSGIVDIDGEKVLYVGVSEEDYADDEKSSNLKKAFQDRFLDLPILIKPTEGINKLQGDATKNSLAPLVFTNDEVFQIYDNTDRQGTVSPIEVLNDVTIGNISVEVNIVHTFITDLIIDLVTPNGTIVVLQDRERDDKISFDRTYTDELLGLIGSDAQGTWTLRIGDYAPRDSGRLTSWTLTIIPEAPPEEVLITTPIFEDNFSNGFVNYWTTDEANEDTGWESSTLTENSVIPGFTRSNIVAESTNCSTVCSLTLSTPIDLTEYDSAYLTFDRRLDNTLDTGEYLKVEVGSGTNYREVGLWNKANGDTDDLWHREVIEMSSADLLLEDFKVRFSSLNSSTHEEVSVDNVVLIINPPTREERYPGCSSPFMETVMGGDLIIIEETENTNRKCGTLTIGGVETEEGKRGFIISSHIVDKNEFDLGNSFVGHHLLTSNTISNPLGKVAVMPEFIEEEFDEDNDEDEILVTADAAFVEYPESAECAQSWTTGTETVCFRFEAYDERVVEKSIRGKQGTVYKVVGSTRPKANMEVNITGASTGRELYQQVQQNSTGAVGEKLLYRSTDGAQEQYSYVYPIVGAQYTVPGDSGAPVYTTPNSSNQVQLVGILVGSFAHPGNYNINVFNSWEDVVETLDLKKL